MTDVQARALVHQGRTFVVPSATVALDRDERLALAIVTSGAFGYGGQRIAYSLEPGAIDLSLVRSGRCPLLVEHHPYVENLLGSVVAATVEGDELRLLCRFARGGRSDEIWSMLEQGFPLSVSAGGEIEHAEPAGEDLVRAVRWKLVEVSVCVRGRDERAHIRPLAADEDAAAMMRAMDPNDPDGLARRLALRRRLRLDDWQRWVDTAAPRLARAVGADPDATADALGALVSEHVREIEEATTP